MNWKKTPTPTTTNSGSAPTAVKSTGKEPTGNKSTARWQKRNKKGSVSKDQQGNSTKNVPVPHNGSNTVSSGFRDWVFGDNYCRKTNKAKEALKA